MLWGQQGLVPCSLTWSHLAGDVSELAHACNDERSWYGSAYGSASCRQERLRADMHAKATWCLTCMKPRPALDGYACLLHNRGLPSHQRVAR